MNEERERKTRTKKAGKECAYLAVFVALLIGAQLCLSAIPGVEVVTVLFLSYAFVFGIRRGMLAATAFSLLRQLVFGFFPSVLIVYLLYYNFTAFVFGGVGRLVKKPLAVLWWLTLLACVCTFAFSLLDCLVTPLWYGFTEEAARAYFFAAIPVALPQLICTALTVVLLFLPLERAFASAKKRL